MPITNNLKVIRKNRHMNQEEVAVAIGTTRKTIGRIEKGERNPSLEIALRLAIFFEVNVEDIFSVEDI